MININPQKITVTLEFNGNSFTISTYKYKPISLLRDKAVKHFYPLRNQISLFYMNKNISHFEEKPIGFFFKTQNAATIQIKEIDSTNLTQISVRKLNQSLSTNRLHNKQNISPLSSSNSTRNIFPYISKRKNNISVSDINIDMLCFGCHSENVKFYCRTCNKFLCLNCAFDQIHSEHKLMQLTSNIEQNVNSYKDKLIYELTQAKENVNKIDIVKSRKVDIGKWRRTIFESVSIISTVSNKLKNSTPVSDSKDSEEYKKEYENAKKKLQSIQVDKYKDPFELFSVINHSEKEVHHLFNDSVAHKRRDIMKKRIVDMFTELNNEIDNIIKSIKSNSN